LQKWLLEASSQTPGGLVTTKVVTTNFGEGIVSRARNLMGEIQGKGKRV
jgi:hypothetical protein